MCRHMTAEQLEDYGRQLQSLREQAQLTRDEVGLALGYTKESARNVVGRWERGERLPHIYQIPMLMKLYNVRSAADLMPRVTVSIPPGYPYARERTEPLRHARPVRW